MKNILQIGILFALMLGLVACGANQERAVTDVVVNESTTNAKIEEHANDTTASTEATDNEESAEGRKTLVVYFSLPETTNPDNMTTEEDNSVVVIDGEILGNTQYVAYVIQKNTDADIFRIEPKTPYTTDHKELVDQASKEQSESARPELLKNVDNLDQYDTIFVGYPNWWGDMPMILYTFFESNDFTGKSIIPFNTHGGSGFSNTIQTIEELEPDASVNEDGFMVSRSNVQDAEPDIIGWLVELGYTN